MFGVSIKIRGSLIEAKEHYCSSLSYSSVCDGDNFNSLSSRKFTVKGLHILIHVHMHIWRCIHFSHNRSNDILNNVP